MQTLDAFHLLDDRSPVRVAMSVSAYAQTHGFSRTHTWRWLVKQRPEYDKLSTAFPGIWSSTQASVSSSPAPAHARRMLAHVLAPVPRPSKSTPGARRMVAVIGSLLLTPKDGEVYRSLQISALRLGVLTGVPNGRPALKAAVGYRWVVEQTRRAQAPVLKLNRVPSRFVWTPALWDAVDALVAGDLGNMCAAVLLSASHPAWDVLGPAAWIEAVTLAVPYESLLSRTNSKAARALLEQWGYPLLEPAKLHDWLDRVAVSTGAVEARKQLVQARNEAAEARAEATREVRRIRSLVPAAPDDAAALGQFFETMLRLMLTEPTHAREVERTMLKRVEKRHDDALGLWLGWLVSMWVEKAPTDDVDENKVRQRRQAVAPAAVQSLRTDTVASEALPRTADGSIPEAATQAMLSGIAWVATKRNPENQHEDSLNDSTT